jgi:HJR/Mrr/RecB family endonuclease
MQGSLAMHDIYSVTPADLAAADEELRRSEYAWRQAGAVRVSEPQVAQSRQIAQERQRTLKAAKARSRLGITLAYLHLVRLLVLTGLPRYGKTVAIAVFATIPSIFCVLPLLLLALVFPALEITFRGMVLLTVLSAGLMAGAACLLWPTEYKRQAFQNLQRQRKERLHQVETLRAAAAQAWADFKTKRQQWLLTEQLDQARQRRQEIAAVIATVKYQLIHTDWRSLRSVDFEHFLTRVFEMLGYHVDRTKATADQGADLIVTGKGRRIAVQAKGYADGVGNHSVMEVTAGMSYYKCDSCAVITNSRFTRAAKHLATATQCRLIEGSQMRDLIEGRIF